MHWRALSALAAVHCAWLGGVVLGDVRSRHGEGRVPRAAGHLLEPLLPQLRAAQPLGYQVPGVPVLMVVVRGSEYERLFVTPKLRSV